MRLQHISIYILYTPYKNIHLSSKYSRLCQQEVTRKSAEVFIKTKHFHLCVFGPINTDEIVHIHYIYSDRRLLVEPNKAG